jgi:hypothetical protein
MSNGDFWQQSTWQMFNGNPAANPPTPGLLQTAMGPMQVARSVFPTVVTGKDESISADTIDPATGVPTTGVTRAVATLQYPFQLAPVQVNDPALTIAMNQVTLAAQAIAVTEDRLFLNGQDADLPKRPAPRGAGAPLVNVAAADLQKLNTGLIGIAAANKKIEVPPSAPGVQAWGVNTYTKVLEAIAEFTLNAQGPPYALILAPDVFADTYIYASVPVAAAPAAKGPAPPAAAPAAGYITPADIIQALLASGPFVASAGLKPKQGLLASLGGKTTTLYVGTGPLVEFNTYANSLYSFTARESIQFVNVDSRSLIMLDFK